MKKLAKLCKEYIEQGGEPVVSGAFGLRMAEINMSEVQLYMLENMDASFNELLFMLIDRTGQKDSDVYHKTEFEYYKKAAELGNTRAMVYVGIAYKQGYPVNRNCDMAFNCFAKATELGDEYLAPYYLAECYENGSGVETDENAAVMYYTMSAECGNIPSMLALSRIYKEGLGSIEKDEQKSAKYLFMSGVGRD